ncbi:InlB B-repeat-containing protein [Treponema zioleckii]|uniref:pectate lyase family protein n=1 Tax=Treponema zioleckii TaxID=331680 RepID=UPI00168C0FAC|nr:hypothetical protein [Treponema zioleckii]
MTDSSSKNVNEDGTTTLKIEENGSGFVSSTGNVATTFVGYTGNGYLDGITDGGNIVYTVSATEAITDAKIAIHYCNTEASRIRGALVSVNGTVLNEDSPFAMTYTFKGNKTDSSDETVAKRWVDTAYLENVSLNAGSNSIIVSGAPAGTYTPVGGGETITISDGNSGCLNYVDYLIVSGKGIDYGTDTTKYVSLSYASENTTAGSVESSVTASAIAENSDVTFTATANSGWKFECWSDGSTSNPYTKTISESSYIFAHFIPENYTVPTEIDGYMGYATVTNDSAAGYTITGGAGAISDNRVTISDYTALTSTYKDLLASDVPAIIFIDSVISTASQSNPLLSVKLNVGSNKTIYGNGTGQLRNIEFVVEGENVIIRNLKLGEVVSWDGYTKSGADDALSLNGATHVWVDHCEFQSHLTPQDLDGNEITSGDYYSTDEKWKKDFYDGLLDIKNGSTWITISNCYFHDHWKACLCASGDATANTNTTTGATDKDMRITFVNNYWKDINARQPLFRWGKAHIFNSYFVSSVSEISGQSTGINCRAGSELYIDNNTFENIKTPIGYYNDESASNTGYWVNEDNTFTNCTNSVASSSTSYKPPYIWTPKPASEAKTYVQSNAGATLTSLSY